MVAVTERLTCFLYMLLRDELPAGEVERIMLEVDKVPTSTCRTFSNPHLENYARELATRLGQWGGHRGSDVQLPGGPPRETSSYDGLLAYRIGDGVRLADARRHQLLEARLLYGPWPWASSPMCASIRARWLDLVASKLGDNNRTVGQILNARELESLAQIAEAQVCEEWSAAVVGQ